MTETIASKGTESIGIDLGLKDLATLSNGQYKLLRILKREDCRIIINR
jgi:transposase